MATNEQNKPTQETVKKEAEKVVAEAAKHKAQEAAAKAPEKTDAAATEQKLEKAEQLSVDAAKPERERVAVGYEGEKDLGALIGNTVDPSVQATGTSPQPLPNPVMPEDIPKYEGHDPALERQRKMDALKDAFEKIADNLKVEQLDDAVLFGLGDSLFTVGHLRAMTGHDVKSTGKKRQFADGEKTPTEVLSDIRNKIPPDTPDHHVLATFAGVPITVGDLRSMK